MAASSHATDLAEALPAQVVHGAKGSSKVSGSRCQELRGSVDRRFTAADEVAVPLRCFVTLTDLVVQANIGVHDDERRRRQPLVVNVEAEVHPPAEDHLAETLDYVLIARIAGRLAEQHVGLVETFAKQLAEECLRQPGVTTVSVSVRKPKALSNGLAGARIVMSAASSPLSSL